MMQRIAIILFILIPQVCFALPSLSGSVSGDSASRLVLQQSSKNSSTTVNSKGKFSIKGKNSGNRLTLVKPSGQVGGPVVFGIKNGNKVVSVNKARKDGLCQNSDSRAVLAVKKKRKKARRKKAQRQVRLRGLNFDSSSGFAEVRSISGGAPDSRSRFLARVNSNCAPSGARLGINAQSNDQPYAMFRSVFSLDDIDGDGIENEFDLDDDNDGMPDAFDIDDDADGVLDNDDPDSQNVGTENGLNLATFWVFSNFHLDLEESLNINAASVTKEQIDAALVDNAGLAIQVVGGGTLDVELDCGELSYCSEGGTGRGREPYPDGLKFPEEVDTDSDGLGTITPGSTGDFQLATNATSDQIGAGDVFLQRVTDENGKEVQIPGMLNFIFHTTPAAKQVVTAVDTYDVSYPVTTGAAGTPTNCFKVPATGNVEVTLTVWRPQRPGITEAGESEFVDMGNLRLLTNIPNAPCVPGGDGQCSGGSSSGPGLCASSVYSTSDSNLTVVSDGLQDSLGDQPADSSNTFTYTIDLTQCLTDAGLSWSAGERLNMPLQMMNQFGDNAAQNICFTREDANPSPSPTVSPSPSP